MTDGNKPDDDGVEDDMSKKNRLAAARELPETRRARAARDNEIVRRNTAPIAHKRRGDYRGNKGNLRKGMDD